MFCAPLLHWYVYLATVHIGSLWSISVIECNTNYHHNFAVKNGMRTYYGNILNMIRVGKHQFIEKQVIDLWISMMLLLWFVLLYVINLIQCADFNDRL